MSGIFGSSQWMYASGFYNGVATQSLRFDDGSSAYLNFAPTSSATSATTGTLSFWVKRATLSTNQYVFHAKDTSVSPQPTVGITFNTDDTLSVTQYDGTSPFNSSNYDFGLTTSAKFRDVGAWYHFILKIDTTNATEEHRFKLYVNGVDTTLNATNPGSGSQDFPSVNQTTAFFQVGNQRWGATVDTNTFYDGYLAETNGIDGTALDETDFGEFKNGVWIAKAYTGSYGTNGFRLQFNQTGTGTASSSTIGADTSGNANHFSSSGIVASDCAMPDSPENNFATFNSVDPSNPTFSEGNLKAAFSGSGNGTSRSTIGITSGKWYAEFYQVTVGNGVAVGAVGEDASISAWPSIVDGSVYVSIGAKNINGSESSYGTGYSDGDIIGVALDMDAGSITLYLNNSSQGVMNTGLSGEHFFSFSDGSGATSGTAIVNFGQDSSFVGVKTAQGNTDDNGKGDFYYSPPGGFLALCTANLPEPTISPNETTQADDYFNTLLYTGDGNNTRSITGVGFQPDWVWLKRRSSAQNHRVFDIVRGSTKGLYTNLTDEEASGQDANGVLSSFDSDGFSTVNGSLGVNAVNQNTETYVAWNWKAGGTAVSNTDGTITSSVSANTDAGFSIVNYTGTGSSATVGHGLGKKPSLIFIKRRAESSNWAVAGSVLGSTATLYLNLTNAQETYSDPTIINTQTTTTFSIGTDTNRNKNTFEHIAYCFAEIEGYSKIGSYTANSSADGPMIYLGFRPKWVLIKKIDGAASWWLVDAVRDTYNPTDSYILPDTSDADRTYTTADFLSNGFKIRNTSTAFNSGTHIYMAFAEAPFKYANAR